MDIGTSRAGGASPEANNDTADLRCPLGLRGLSFQTEVRGLDFAKVVKEEIMGAFEKAGLREKFDAIKRSL